GLAVWAYRAVKQLRLPVAPSQDARPRRESVLAPLGGIAAALAVVSLLLVGAGQPLVAVLLPVFVLVVGLAVREAVLRRPEGGVRLFVLALIGLGLGLTMGVDIVILEGDVVRMNTVFKFYLHAWVVFALASAFLAWHLFGRWRPLLAAAPSSGRVPRLAAQGALAGFGLLLAGVALYPLFATPVRLDDRFAGSTSREIGRAHV